MKNRAIENRVENELSRWLSREQRFQKLFSFSLSTNRDFIKEKLRFYRNVTSRFKDQASPEERLTLRMMRHEKRVLEKQLFPNIWIRLVYKAISGITQGVKFVQEQQRQATNIEELKASINKLGFPEVSIPLEQLGNKNKISIPFSYQVGAKEHIDFDLSLQQGNKGYEIKGYMATLHRHNGNPAKISCYFHEEGANKITARQAQNLLSGRAVMTGNKENRHWMQLDFNDRDAKGNYKVKRFYSGYGFDLEKKLCQLPLQELRNKEGLNQLLTNIENGERPEVTLVQDSKKFKIAIEADPRFKSLIGYNAKGQKIPLNSTIKMTHSKKTGRHHKTRLRKGFVGNDRMRVKRK